MIIRLQGDDAKAHVQVIDEMFRARKRLFKDRLEWDVTVDARGWEVDEYDAITPVYLIAVDDEGLLPTTGETMLRDHFRQVFDGVTIESPLIWECTRFCVDSDATENLTPHGVQRVTTELLLGICETGLKSGISQIVGVFDRRMIRIYSRGGWSPEVVGQSGEGRDAVFLGLWDVTEENAAAIRHAGGFSGSVLGRMPVQPRRQARSDVA
jgi:acyl homoserine lactone synthase